MEACVYNSVGCYRKSTQKGNIIYIYSNNHYRTT